MTFKHAFFDQAVADAQAYRDRVVATQAQRRNTVPDFASSVVVITKALGPDNSTMLPCGEASFPRCVADQFETGRLVVSSIDDGYELRTFEPSQWAECTVFGPDGHILYSWSNR